MNRLVALVGWFSFGAAFMSAATGQVGWCATTLISAGLCGILWGLLDKIHPDKPFSLVGRR